MPIGNGREIAGERIKIDRLIVVKVPPEGVLDRLPGIRSTAS
jgi:hypothetical protein